MDIPSTVISTLRLAQSVMSPRQSASEKRQALYNAIAGQKISFTPERGERIELHLRNCGYDEGENETVLSVSIHDPQRPEDFFNLETDFRYHYTMIFFNDPREVGNLLVSELYFNEVGPEDFRIELCVNSADPPTLQLAFERVETVMAQVHSKYHYFLRSQYKQYSDEFEVLESFNGTKTEYEVGSSIDTEELIPQPFCGETYGWSDDDVDLLDRISMSYRAREYIEYVMKAEAGGDQFFVLN